MFYVCGIDPSTIGKHPFHLFLIKGDLVAVIDRISSLGILISQVINQLVFLQGEINDLCCIFRIDLLVLNSQRINRHYRRFSTNPVASGGTYLNLA
ncbi:hypothetical protein ES703_105038 [subsurface metagenome]